MAFRHRAIVTALAVAGGFFSAGQPPLANDAAEPLPPARPAWMPAVTPLPPPPEEPVRRVDSVEALLRAAAEVEPGETILVAEGHYMIPRYFEITADRVTLRGATGHPRDVVFDGAQSRHGELLGLRACTDVTVADLTIQNVRWNGLKINSETGVQRLTVHHCIFRNIWQRAIKGVRVPAEDRDRLRPTDCAVQYCLFVNDRAKRYEDDPADTAENFRGNYVGGIDVMWARRWTIRDNAFMGIRGRSGEGRGAVFLWHESEDCTVERNLILDCDSGICLGNSYIPKGVAIHAERITVRNNLLVRVPQNGILADYTRDCLIAHNSIHDPGTRLRRLIRLVHVNDGLVVANNLLSGAPIRVETDSAVRFEENVTGDLESAFVDVATGDLRLRQAVEGITAAVDRLDEIPEDFTGSPRHRRTTVGAFGP